MSETEQLLQETAPGEPIKQQHFTHYTFLPYIHKVYWFLYRKPIYFLAFIPPLLGNLINIQLFVFIGRVVDALKGNDPMPEIKKYSLLMFIAAIIASICKFLTEFLWIRIESAVLHKIKRVVFKGFMEKDIEYHDKNSIGDMLSLLNEESTHIKYIYGEFKVRQLRNIGQIVFAFFLSCHYSFILTLFTFSVTLMVTLILKVFRRWGTKYLRRYLAVKAATLTVFEEVISNCKITYAYNNEEFSLKRYWDLCEEESSIDHFMYILFGTCFQTATVINNGTWSLVLTVGSYFILQGRIVFGDLFGLMQATKTFGTELTSIMGTINFEIKGMEAANKIWGMVLEDSKINELEIREDITDLKGNIEFIHVWFKYNTRDKWILQDISFKIKEGSIAAFVGHSGCGKSTIIQLLLRFYEVDDGEILIGGINIKSISPSLLRRKIGYIMQEPNLFTLNVKDNIKYGNPTATDEEIENAAKIALADSFIRKLPDGYNSYIGEKGQELSGGQRQRVAIARAVVKKSSILFADEITAAFDAKSSNKVQAALENVMKGRTCLFISHRLGMIKDSDVIYVLDKGQIVEYGKHDELYAHHGFYYELINIQNQ